jgi:hypothetical protein
MANFSGDGEKFPRFLMSCEVCSGWVTYATGV